MPPAQPPATKPARRRGWRIFFAIFKWCRVSLLLLLFGVIILGLFLNHVGLPDWMERRVEEQFRASGWDLKFRRLRLHWYHGIVAEDLQLQRTNSLRSPHLFLQTAEFRLNGKALRHLRLEADSVMLNGGRLRWELPGTNQAQRTLALDDIGGELLFRPGDLWELRFLETRLLGMQTRLRGDLTNASLIREWRMPALPTRPGEPPGGIWPRLLAEAEKVRFTGTPELNAIFYGDARDWKSFDAQLKFNAHAAESPWGGATNISLTARLLPPPRSNEAVRVDLTLDTEQTRLPWGLATNLHLTLVGEPSFTQLLPTNALALLELRGMQTPWGRADRFFVELRSSPSGTNDAFNHTRLDMTLEQFTGEWAQARLARVTATGAHPATNFFPAALETVGTLRDTRTPWATSEWTQVSARLDLPPLAEMRLAEANLLWPERLRNIPLTASTTFSNAIAPAIELDRGGLNVHWRFPNLEVESGTATAGNAADVRVTVQTETRETRFEANTSLDPQKLAPFLGTNARPWLAVCTFDSRPRLQVAGHAVLPDWTRPQTNWHGELLPSVSMAGQFDSDTGSCRGVAFTSIHAPFTLTNLSWTATGLKITRPEGGLEVTGGADQQTGDFHGAIRSDFDPLALRAAFPQEVAQRVFGFFEFTTPPHVTTELAGNWQDWTSLRAAGNAALTNVVFRGQAVKACVTRLSYTNQFLSILEPIVLREGEQGLAAGLGIDFVQHRLFLTNAVGRMDPRAVTRSIGPIPDKAIEPFVFDLPPTARVEGMVALAAGKHDDDMRFEVEGGPFHWQRFHLEHVKATVLWRGHTLTITNLLGRWRGADVAASVFFQFTPKGQGDIFSFQVRVKDADLRTVLKDLEPGNTNKVEGKVSGELFITRADTHDWKSWQGHGHAQLTNGLLWEIPLFGVFSPVLNAFFPGLGNSRARQAGTTFQITNSVIYSKDLEIRATAMRMKYQGTVDFDQRVEGRMEAELLRDMPALGFLISKVFWPVTKLFEYKITGTLANPKTEQLYVISKVFILPFAPIKTLKDIFNQAFVPEEKPAGTPPSSQTERPPP
jgi:hypothetical protein